MTRRTIFAAIIGLAALFHGAPAQAQWAIGPQASYIFDAGNGDGLDMFGIGVRAQNTIGSYLTSDASNPFSRTRFVGTFDWFFPDCPNGVDCSYLEFNFNGAVPFTLEKISPYLGAGLNIARTHAEVNGNGDSNTDAGLNLLGGLDLHLGNMAAFTEARLELGGGEGFALTFGLLF